MSIHTFLFMGSKNIDVVIMTFPKQQTYLYFFITMLFPFLTVANVETYVVTSRQLQFFEMISQSVHPSPHLLRIAFQVTISVSAQGNISVSAGVMLRLGNGGKGNWLRCNSSTVFDHSFLLHCICCFIRGCLDHEFCPCRSLCIFLVLTLSLPLPCFVSLWRYRGHLRSFECSQALHWLLLPSIINCISFKPSLF